MTYKEKVIDLLKRMMADTKKKRDYLERYECSEDVKRLDGGLNFANNFLAALTSIKEDPVPERIGNEPEDFVVEGKTIIVNEPPVDDQPQFNLDVDESNVFTEPAESEDEKVRKCLIAMVNATIWESSNLASKKACLDWLEKQKEPHYTKRNALFDKCVENCDPEVMEEVSNKVDEMLGKEQKPAERAEINKSLSDAVIAELDKYNGENYWKSPWLIDSTGLHYPLYFAKLGATWQKEQKPAWSEEEKDFMDTLIARIFGSPNITTILAPDDCYWFKKALTEIRNKMDLQYSGDEKQAIKKHIDSLRSQSKPAEWSEKDKHILKNIHDFVKENTGNPHRVNCVEECLNWLKSLPKRFNLQPQQGWSEEDEDKVAQYLHDRDGGMLWSKATEITRDILDMLRPSWKPSEEQMEVLRKYVMGEWKGLTFKEDEHLKSLLIDLENYSHDNR